MAAVGTLDRQNGVMVRRIKLKRSYDSTDRRAVRYRAMLFRPLGMYPRGTICTPTGLFHADDEIVFAVTHGPTWWGSSDHLPYSEVDWMEPELVRLLGAMMLAEKMDGVRPRFYPMSHGGFVLNEQAVDLCDARTAMAVKKALLNTVNNRMWKQVQAIWPQCIDQEFVLFDQGELEVEEVPSLWNAMGSDNHLLMRGVQALVKSDMLGAHPEFQEEGAIATFIALDASFQMVLRLLRANGNPTPSAKDAGKWMYETFDLPLELHAGADIKYYEDFYDSRVKTMHPGSRFGDMPYAPVMVDDRFHLRESLPSVFAYLVLRRHSPSFLREVEARHVRR